MKQAVLGGTGNIGNLLVLELLERGIDIKSLNRTTPEHTLEGVEYVSVDAENADQLREATQDVSVLYGTVAIPYGTESWQQSWPVVIKNIIEAAKANKCKVVFLDNVYMYGKVDGLMTEETPVKPVSKKGEVRARIAQMMLDAMQAGDITGAIARSADFYGPHTRISDRFFQDASKDGVATWMGSPDVLRTWSYIYDNAKALAILGNDERADQQIWHMPAAPAMKGTEFIALAGKILGKELKVNLVPGTDPEARKAFEAAVPEIAEMMYQYDDDYIFDSTKFQQTFGVQPTSYEDGFKRVFDTLAKGE